MRSFYFFLSFEGVLEGTLDLYDEVSKAYEDDPWFQQEQHTAAYAYRDGLWWIARNQRIVPNKQTLRQAIIAEMHDTTMFGHTGITKTKAEVQQLFWWPSLHGDVTKYVKHCPSCQMHKSSSQKSVGRLKPLPIPDCMWQMIKMDFITALPCTKNGHTAILVTGGFPLGSVQAREFFLILNYRGRP